MAVLMRGNSVAAQSLPKHAQAQHSSLQFNIIALALYLRTRLQPNWATQSAWSLMCAMSLSMMALIIPPVVPAVAMSLAQFGFIGQNF
jgi:hypothetical protein